MHQPKIYPVILCGGSGTRLWPLSRKSYPKQFAKLASDLTLFQETAVRLNGPSFAPPVVVTGSDFRFIVTQQLAEIGVDPGAVLIEPEGRNTAPAILAAALHIQSQDPDGVMLVAPSDHVIRQSDGFEAAVQTARNEAMQGKLVTFGITPDRPETGYGYLEVQKTDVPAAALGLSRFVEKPDLETARRMLADESYLWNAGIFCFSTGALIEAFKIHAPSFLSPVECALNAAQVDLGFLRLDPQSWSLVPDDSIDYAIMEKADNLSVVPLLGGWSDLGGWDAVWREEELDDHGVACRGSVTAIGCSDALLWSEDPELELVGIGLDGVVAIAMPDAVLIAAKDRAQEVKSAVAALKSRNARQAETFPVDHRPWGWFESLAIGERFQVKRIVVKPGAALSLQSHHHRAEHWIVVQGTAKVTIGESINLVAENESVYVPLGEIHRLENPGKVPVVMIEVQTGSYLGEDDIIRYEDVYARGQGAKG